MTHPDDFDFQILCGCTVADQSLGFQKMPAGYHLMLDGDGMFYFWMERATGRQGAETWDKWAVRRWAIADKARASEVAA
jgi:hypothetical protein